MNCCQRLEKVAQSAKNRPIWSHCCYAIWCQYLYFNLNIYEMVPSICLSHLLTSISTKQTPFIKGQF